MRERSAAESARAFRNQFAINGLATFAFAAGAVARRSKPPWTIHLTGWSLGLVLAGLIALAVGADHLQMRAKGAKLSPGVAVFDAALAVTSALFMFLLFVGGLLTVPALVLVCLVHGLTAARRRTVEGDTGGLLLLVVVMAGVSTVCAGHPWSARAPLWNEAALATTAATVVALVAFVDMIRRRET